jgi:hypothetical protein
MKPASFFFAFFLFESDRYVVLVSSLVSADNLPFVADPYFIGGRRGPNKKGADSRDPNGAACCNRMVEF